MSSYWVAAVLDKPSRWQETGKDINGWITLA